MAVENSSLGLKYFGLAPVPTGGTLPADGDFVEIGDTQTGNATFAETEPTLENVEIEQQPGTYRVIETASGVITYTMSTYDVSPETLQELKGGDIIPAAAGRGQGWKMGSTAININRCAKLITLDDVEIYVPNARVTGLFNFATQKGALATIQVSLTVQNPGNTALGAIMVFEPAPEGGA